MDLRSGLLDAWRNRPGVGEVDENNTGKAEERDCEEVTQCRVQQKTSHDAWMKSVFWERNSNSTT